MRAAAAAEVAKKGKVTHTWMDDAIRGGGEGMRVRERTSMHVSAQYLDMELKQLNKDKFIKVCENAGLAVK